MQVQKSIKQPISYVDPTRIKDNPFQARTDYAGIDELADKISAMEPTLRQSLGLINVPSARVVIQTPDGETRIPKPNSLPPKLRDGEADWWVELTSGHRRFRAMQQLIAKDPETYLGMPLTLSAFTDEEMDSIAWEENASREDLSPVETAQALQTSMEQFGWSYEKLAKRRQMSVSWVKNKIRLLALPEKLLDALHKGTISERVAASCLPLFSDDIDPADIEEAKLATDINAGPWMAPHPDNLVERLASDWKGGMNSSQVREAVSKAKEQIDLARERRLLGENVPKGRPDPVPSYPIKDDNPLVDQPANNGSSPTPAPQVEPASNGSSPTPAPAPEVEPASNGASPDTAPQPAPPKPSLVMEKITPIEQSVLVSIRIPVNTDTGDVGDFSLSVGVEGNGELPKIISKPYAQLSPELNRQLRTIISQLVGDVAADEDDGEDGEDLAELNTDLVMEAL